MGLLATAGGYFLAEPVMLLLGAGPDVLPRGITFLQIAATTFAPAALLFIGMAALATLVRRCTSNRSAR